MTPNKEKDFWNRFCEYTDLRDVSRIGYTRLGYRDAEALERFGMSRPESVAEHTSGCCMIVDLLRGIYPSEAKLILPDNAREVLQIHELGERITGDLPDNGERDEAAKDAFEMQVVKDFVSCYDPEVAKSLIDGFADLQSKKSGTYMVDKFHFILGQGWDIKNGYEPDPNEYVESLCNLDEYIYEITNCPMPIVNTSVHFLSITRGIYGRDLFIKILEEVFLDLYHAVPKVLEEFY